MFENGEKICIYGIGGFGREVLCCLLDIIAPTSVKIEETVCFMVSDNYYKEDKVMGVNVIPQSKFEPEKFKVVVAVGDPVLRQGVINTLPHETRYAKIIHPGAVISQWVEIGEGSIITAGVILTCNIRIGKHAHLNLHSTIGHDCTIGDYFTAAPAANISGKCQIGDCVYFGTNSSVRERVKICNNVTIGMGGVVVKDIAEEGVYIGNPLKKLNK